MLARPQLPGPSPREPSARPAGRAAPSGSCGDQRMWTEKQTDKAGLDAGLGPPWAAFSPPGECGERGGEEEGEVSE